MEEAQTMEPRDSPLMKAWEAYKSTDAYQNTRRWAQHEAHVDGSLWAAFSAGFRATAEAPRMSSEPLKEYQWRVGDVFTDGTSRWQVDAIRGNKASLRSCSSPWATTILLTYAEWHEGHRWKLAEGQPHGE